MASSIAGPPLEGILVAAGFSSGAAIADVEAKGELASTVAAIAGAVTTGRSDLKVSSGLGHGQAYVAIIHEAPRDVAIARPRGFRYEAP